MRLAFYQAAMLTVAVQASEAASQDEAEPSYFPDLLVQTASIVDYFYPFVHDEEHSVETALAQIDPSPIQHGQVETEADAEVDVEADADADAELDALIDAEIESEVGGEVVLDSEALDRIESKCAGNEQCIKQAIKGLTRINHQSKDGSHLMIEQPAAKKTKISYEDSNLSVEDEEWNRINVPMPVSVPIPVPVPVKVPVKVPILHHVEVPVPVPTPVPVEVPVKKPCCEKPTKTVYIDVQKSHLSQLDSESESEAEIDSASENEGFAESDSDSNAEIESASEGESENEGVAESESDSEADAELDSDSESEDTKSVFVKSAGGAKTLGKFPNQLEASFDNEWPESDTMKQQMQAGKIGGQQKQKNSWESKAAKEIMDGHEEWPEHQSIKERLRAGTIGKEPERQQKVQPPSAAAKLLKNSEMDQWPANDLMGENFRAGKTNSSNKKQELYEPFEWPENEAVKERLNSQRFEGTKPAGLMAQVEVYDESEPFDGSW